MSTGPPEPIPANAPTVYLDTSALVALYIAEPHTDPVRSLVQSAASVVTSRIGYAEARAAFARMRRERTIPRSALVLAVEQLNRDWEGLSVVEVTDRVVRSAGDLVERHPLRGYDAVHLASAMFLREDAGVEVEFCCQDTRLAAAARAERLRVHL